MLATYFGSNDETAVRWNLGKVYELGLVKEGEILCELEGAAHGSDPGLLVVTDLKVLFVRRPLVGRTTARSLPLERVVRAEASMGGPFRRTKGRLVISVRGDELPAAKRLGLGRFGDLLQDGEVPLLHEEDVWLGWRPGRLLVTDRRVAFLMGGALWRRRAVFSASYPEIDFASLEEDPDGADVWKLKLVTNTRVRASYVVLLRMLDRARAESAAHLIESVKRGDEVATPNEDLEFDGIQGGQERAKQIAVTIIRQRELLGRAGARAGARTTSNVEEESDDVPAIAFSIGRGVAKWVNQNGGRLYVWSDTFSPAFDVVRADIEPPPDVGFVPSRAVSEFELYVEDGMPLTRPIHISRRWFGLRDGVSVDTGLVDA
jgi:hypothetical protein